ncbi:MAG: hypothetical protein K6E59_02295 [Bacilli bacterium]|nr:hypothetical protein [Bacilli bacterium]
MKRVVGITIVVGLCASLGLFIGSFFVTDALHIVFLCFGVPAIAFVFYSLHELTHLIAVKVCKSKLVGLHLVPFLYEKGKWSLNGQTMAVTFVELSAKKSMAIYASGILFTTLVEIGLALLCLAFRLDWLYCFLAINGAYFITTFFKDGDFYHLIRLSKTKRKEK